MQLTPNTDRGAIAREGDGVAFGMDFGRRGIRCFINGTILEDHFGAANRNDWLHVFWMNREAIWAAANKAFDRGSAQVGSVLLGERDF